MKIDYTQLQTYISCPRKYRNRYLLNLRKIGYDERDVAKSFGSCVHEALDRYFKNRNIDEALCSFDGYVDMEDDNVKTANNGKELVRQYVEWEKLNFPSYDILSLETTDEFSIGDISYLVKMDKVVKMNGNIYVMDYKTTTSKGAYFFNNFDPNMQVDGYVDYVMRKYGSCSGFLPIAMFHGYRSKKSKLGEAGFWCRFDYQPVNRTKEQITNFEEEVKEWVNRLNSDTMFPKNKGNCCGFKGCEYRELCLANDDEGIMSNLYNVVDNKEYLNDGKTSAD